MKVVASFSTKKYHPTNNVKKVRCQRQCRVDDKVYNKIVWKRIYGFGWHNKICPLHFFFFAEFIIIENCHLFSFFFIFFILACVRYICNLTRQQSIFTHAFTRAHNTKRRTFQFSLLKCLKGGNLSTYTIRFTYLFLFYDVYLFIH